MYEYAIHEIHTLVRALPSPIDDRSPEVRYLCALFAELAYHHIPQWEIDGNKRAKFIPCKAYRALIARGRPTNVSVLFPELDLRCRIPDVSLLGVRGGLLTAREALREVLG